MGATKEVLFIKMLKAPVADASSSIFDGSMDATEAVTSP